MLGKSLFCPVVVIMAHVLFLSRMKEKGKRRCGVHSEEIFLMAGHLR